MCECVAVKLDVFFVRFEIKKIPTEHEI
jgi:hypothetical protein